MLFFNIMHLIYDYSLLLLKGGFAPLYHETTYINNSIFQKACVYFILLWDDHASSTEAEKNAALLGKLWPYNIVKMSLNCNVFFIILSKVIGFSFLLLCKRYWFCFEFHHHAMGPNNFWHKLNVTRIQKRWIIITIVMTQDPLQNNRYFKNYVNYFTVRMSAIWSCQTDMKGSDGSMSQG